MKLNYIDYIVMAAFFAVLFLIPAISAIRSKSKGANEYFKSAGSMPWWLIGVSMVAATTSTNSANLFTEIIREDGLSGNWAWWAFLLTGMLTENEDGIADQLGSVYHHLTGLEKIDDHTFRIHLTSPDPRFVYAMAMPYFSVVSRKAVEYYGKRFSDHPCGSGPFILKSWQKDHQIRLIKNPEYRTEYFTEAENAADRNRKLPLCDEIVCDLVKQPMSGWLLFLQGELDSYALDGENFAAVVNKKLQIPASLQKRGIILQRAPEMQINYIGFSFADPLLGQNENLRKAISLAFNREVRIEYGAGKLHPAHGPVPPGASGHIPTPGKFTQRNLDLAKEYMKKAGFPGGVDPQTGKPLEISFDQAGSDTFYLQTAELLAIDLSEIGIKVKPEFNNRARFLQKLAGNQVQMFRLSWTGDYPDAENFLQLFYGPNSGASNRVCCDLPEINEKYEKIKNMGASEERDRRYLELADLIRSKCPWIFESYTVSFLLKHCWLENMRPHDFAFQRWKYISVNPQKRAGMKRTFEPLSLKELRGE